MGNQPDTLWEMTFWLISTHKSHHRNFQKLLEEVEVILQGARVHILAGKSKSEQIVNCLKKRLFVCA